MLVQYGAERQGDTRNEDPEKESSYIEHGDHSIARV